MGVLSKIITKRNAFPLKNWKIMLGDQVFIREGKDKGETGKIIKVIQESSRVIVEGKNLVKKTVRRSNDSPGGIITMEAPLHVSNVMVLDPVTSGPVRITWTKMEDGKTVRIGKGKHSSGTVIPEPEEHLASLPDNMKEALKNPPPELVQKWMKAGVTSTLEETFASTIAAEEPNATLLAEGLKLLKINTRARIEYDILNPLPKDPLTGLTKPEAVRKRKDAFFAEKAKREAAQTTPKQREAMKRKEDLRHKTLQEMGKLKSARIAKAHQAEAQQVWGADGLP